MAVVNICVFCSASNKVSNEYKFIAKQCADMLIKFNLNLVYGGGNCGLMGVVSKAMHESNKKVIGIYPQILSGIEPLDHNMDKTIIVKTMGQRKEMMIAKSDAFLILPGGFGTLDELFEVITLKLIKQHNKPIIIYNYKGFWNNLVKLCQDITEKDFAFSHAPQSYTVVDTLEEAFKELGYI